jgi:hypothetical protein
MIKRARRDPNVFIEYVFKHYDRETKTHVPFVQGWMHRQWQALMGIHDRLIIVAPRSHGKTTNVVARVLWELGNDPNHIIKIVCQSNAKAVKRLTAIRTHMKNNKRLHEVFPHLSEKAVQEQSSSEWNKHQVTVERTISSPDPSIEALGITSSASGDRATIIVADDVVDRRNAITLPKVRKQIKDAWDDWVNLIDGAGGKIWYICTLWHEEALTSELMKTPGWAVGWYEITNSLGCFVELPDGRTHRASYPLWGWDPSCPVHRAPGDVYERPERDARCRCGAWTKPRLEARKRELGPRKFARGFSNRPITSGERVVHPDWIHWYEGDLYRGEPDDWLWYVCIDSAESIEGQAAWTGVAIGAVNPENGHVLIWDGYHEKLMFPHKVQMVKDLYKELRPEVIIIELAGGGWHAHQDAGGRHEASPVGVDHNAAGECPGDVRGGAGRGA